MGGGQWPTYGHQDDMPGAEGEQVSASRSTMLRLVLPIVQFWIGWATGKSNGKEA
jgi:hypothetical protein